MNSTENGREEDVRMLTLSMKVLEQLKIWLVKAAWSMKMDIKCQLSSMSRGGNSTLVSQQCHGKVKF